MCGRVWGCVGMCGRVWACVSVCGHVWACVDMCGSALGSMETFAAIVCLLAFANIC